MQKSHQNESGAEMIEMRGFLKNHLTDRSCDLNLQFKNLFYDKLNNSRLYILEDLKIANIDIFVK